MISFLREPPKNHHRSQLNFNLSCHQHLVRAGPVSSEPIFASITCGDWHFGQFNMTEISTVFIPHEIVRLIIAHLLPPLHAIEVTESTGNTCKRDQWALIQPLVYASRAYREIALEAWFRTFFVRNPVDVTKGKLLFPKIGRQWVRYVLCDFHLDNTHD